MKKNVRISFLLQLYNLQGGIVRDRKKYTHWNHIQVRLSHEHGKDGPSGQASVKGRTARRAEWPSLNHAVFLWFPNNDRAFCSYDCEGV